MSLNAATLRLLAEKGLSATDIVEVAEAMEVRRDPTAAERMRRHRAKNAVKSVTRNVTDERDADAPPNDIYSNPPVKPGEANASPSPFADQVVLAWNAGPAAKGARKAIKLDTTRKTQLRARVKDHGEAGVLAAIANLGASRFHCGENDRGWRANIGWLLEPKHCLQALEMTDEPAPSAKPVEPHAFRAFALTSAERSRAMGREQEALDWEAKARGEEPRRASTGPPRSVAALIPAHIKQAANA